MKRRREQERTVFDLIEEATHVLRTTPVATLAVYYLGTIPFVLGFLFFWADMSRNPYAGRHLAEASLGMGLLFLWMKFWQVIFARRVRARLAVEPMPRPDPRRLLRIFLTQAVLQPSGLFVLPILALPVVPFLWAYSFYQNLTALADGEESTAKLFKKAARQASSRPMQNFYLLAIMAFFSLYVLLNWAAVCFILPRLVKMLFGVESVFTRSAFAMLNTTFFAAMIGLTYLCVDPLLKTLYALRCFYGESIKSGEDLRAALKGSTIPGKKLAVNALILASLFLSSPARSAETDPVPATPPVASATPPVSGPALDKAIDDTIHERKFTWRMPREKMVDADENDGAVTRFFRKTGEMLRKWTRSTLQWLDKWLRKLLPHPHPRSATAGGMSWNLVASVQLLLWILVAAAAAVLGVFLYRLWQRRRKTPVVAMAEAIQPVPDITDENVAADQLPEDGWTRLARELLERGEFRLAMRAFYLASLSHLAARNLISIARFKSNREYERELRRRGHSFPELLSVFGDNIVVFESIWYGMHEVSPDLVGRFAANVERLRSGA